MLQRRRIVLQANLLAGLLYPLLVAADLMADDEAFLVVGVNFLEESIEHVVDAVSVFLAHSLVHSLLKRVKAHDHVVE